MCLKVFVSAERDSPTEYHSMNSDKGEQKRSLYMNTLVYKQTKGISTDPKDKMGMHMRGSHRGVKVIAHDDRQTDRILFYVALHLAKSYFTGSPQINR